MSLKSYSSIVLLGYYRRQKELEAKLVEEETAKRIEEMVAKRVEEELERRREEIEAEVLRRVEAAKEQLEAEMMEELQRQKAAQLEEERRREVAQLSPSSPTLLITRPPIQFYADFNNITDADDFFVGDDIDFMVRAALLFPQISVALLHDSHTL